MSQNLNEPMADVRDMYMAHTMFRREFGLLPQLIRDVREGDVARAKIVGAHAELLCLILHLHHEGEDMYVWPKLHARAGAEAEAIVPTMEAQHHTIEESVALINKLLPPWVATARDGAELADAFDALRAALLEHMALEEREILPLAERFMTAKEWHQLGEHGMKDAPKSALPLGFGMVMYEGDPDTIKSVLANAPLPARLLMPLIGPRIYAKHARKVHGTPTPPRIGRA
ncbi:hemerythrin domain-containing protein [Actinoplanes solisilvae]|uniref:hemerythrin domain-containing protein n=1 Tax=Actinoplanes solisilvae TaxID=2486853 RepID=UPI000FD8E637|nr:hemerythrin domain-containing protein [Actinoplanes solisilvae]